MIPGHFVAPSTYAFDGIGPFASDITHDERVACLERLAEIIHGLGLQWGAIAQMCLQARFQPRDHEGLLVTLNNQPEDDRKAIREAYAASV